MKRKFALIALMVLISAGCGKDDKPAGKVAFVVESVERCNGIPCVSIQGMTEASMVEAEKAKLQVVLKLFAAK